MKLRPCAAKPKTLSMAHIGINSACLRRGGYPQAPEKEAGPEFLASSKAQTNARVG